MTPHERLVAQARDPRLTTSALLAQALEAVRQDWESDEHIPNPALLILQQRLTEEVFVVASALCTRHDPAERQLGVLILREFPGLGQLKPFAVRALPVLERLVERETDDLVLFYGVSAIGWQQHPLARPLLLRFLRHHDSVLRQLVASNLTTCDLANPLPPESVHAYEHLCQDPNDDVRWYARATLQDLVDYEVPLPPTQKVALTRLLAGQ